jgi:putative ABC transport system substrate-binding protein
MRRAHVIVSSLARPGGNITGFATLVPEGFAGKLLELLKEVVPRASRIAVLVNPSFKMHALLLPQSVAAAEALKVRLHIVEARGPDEFESAFKAATRQHAEVRGGGGAHVLRAEPA